eukprot:5462910-Heterocapsa_arctica.AAC.1
MNYDAEGLILARVGDGSHWHALPCRLAPLRLPCPRDCSGRRQSHSVGVVSCTCAPAAAVTQ